MNGPYCCSKDGWEEYSTNLDSVIRSLQINWQDINRRDKAYSCAYEAHKRSCPLNIIKDRVYNLIKKGEGMGRKSLLWKSNDLFRKNNGSLGEPMEIKICENVCLHRGDCFLHLLSGQTPQKGALVLPSLWEVPAFSQIEEALGKTNKQTVLHLSNLKCLQCKIIFISAQGVKWVTTDK